MCDKCDCKCKREMDEIEVKNIYEIEADQEVEIEFGEPVIDDGMLHIDVILEDE